MKKFAVMTLVALMACALLVGWSSDPKPEAILESYAHPQRDGDCDGCADRYPHRHAYAHCGGAHALLCGRDGRRGYRRGL